MKVIHASTFHDAGSRSRWLVTHRTTPRGLLASDSWHWPGCSQHHQPSASMYEPPNLWAYLPGLWSHNRACCRIAFRETNGSGSHREGYRNGGIHSYRREVPRTPTPIPNDAPPRFCRQSVSGRNHLYLVMPSRANNSADYRNLPCPKTASLFATTQRVPQFLGLEHPVHGHYLLPRIRFPMVRFEGI